MTDEEQPARQAAGRLGGHLADSTLMLERLHQTKQTQRHGSERSLQWDGGGASLHLNRETSLW